jgi:hypothetical protein
MGSDRKSDEEKFSGDVRTESPKGNKDRFMDKCKRLLEERNRARLMLLNRHRKNKKDTKYVIKEESEISMLSRNFHFHQVARKSREIPQKTLTYLRKKNEELIERTSGTNMK